MSERTIGAAIAGARTYLREHPDEARYTDSAATASIDRGLRCAVSGPGDALLVSDMTAGVGGEGSAPSPGWLMRAAFAACDATLIAMRAAEEGISLSQLQVVVDSQSDDRGLLGTGDHVPAGPLSIRVRIAIAADGVEDARLREIVAWAREHRPWTTRSVEPSPSASRSTPLQHPPDGAHRGGRAANRRPARRLAAGPARASRARRPRATSPSYRGIREREPTFGRFFRIATCSSGSATSTLPGLARRHQ